MNPYGPPGPPPPGWPATAPPGWPATHAASAEDEQHLDILGICHFIYAAFIGLAGLVGVVYVVIGLVFATAVVSSTGPTGTMPAAAVGGAFAVIGGFVTLALWGVAACLIVSGLGLRRRRRRTFSFVIGCISCMSVPLGTVLGVFTIVVLSRPSVKALYDRVEQTGS